MDSYEYTELLKKLAIKIDNIAQIIKPDEIRVRLKEIEQIEQNPDFWSDAKKAALISKEKTTANSILNRYEKAKVALEDTNDIYEMALEESDDETVEETVAEASNLETLVSDLEVAMMLSGEEDSNNAIVSIHPGAGGTESQDWLVCCIACT